MSSTVQLPRYFPVLKGQSNHAEYRPAFAQHLSRLGLQSLLGTSKHTIDRDAIEAATQAVRGCLELLRYTTPEEYPWRSEEVHGDLGLVIGLIYSSVSHSIRRSLTNDRPKHPSELMKSIDTRFYSPKARQVNLAIYKMFNVKLDHYQNDINMYHSKVLQERTNIEALGTAIDDYTLQCALLAGLPIEYDTLVKKWFDILDKGTAQNTDKLLHDVLNRQVEIPYSYAKKHAMRALAQSRAKSAAGARSLPNKTDDTASEIDGIMTPTASEFAYAGYT